MYRSLLKTTSTRKCTYASTRARKPVTAIWRASLSRQNIVFRSTCNSKTFKQIASQNNEKRRAQIAPCRHTSRNDSDEKETQRAILPWWHSLWSSAWHPSAAAALSIAQSHWNKPDLRIVNWRRLWSEANTRTHQDDSRVNREVWEIVERVFELRHQVSEQIWALADQTLLTDKETQTREVLTTFWKRTKSNRRSPEWRC